MGKKRVRLTPEEREAEREKLHVPNVNTMVMWHTLPDGKKEQRCPFCFSRRLRILDYGCADENEQRFGSFKFIKKCYMCGGLSKAIIDIDEDGHHMRARNRVKEGEE